MKPEEIAAYIGEAAWLPQIATWLYQRYVQPSVSILSDQYAEISFTSLGPIFNLRMAFNVGKKDIIIDGMELVLRHTDGDSRTLRWAGIGETFSEITDAAGHKQIISRDQSPISIKIVTQSLLEKFVRFQESSYHKPNLPLNRSVVSSIQFSKAD